MSFLYPLLWLGALGAAVPLWLHLRRKEPEKLLRFSAVRFLDDQPKPKSASFRLRDPLLLAARLLALLLVVAAFTWPYLRAAAPVVTASRVHLLDNTLSQQVEDGFEKDRKAVVDAISSSAASVQNAAVVLSSRPEVVAGFADERESAVGQLRELAPSHQRGSYLEAFRLAQTLLDQSLGLEKEIVVHGDFQANQWSEHQTSPPFLKGVRVTLAGEPEQEALANLALHEPRSRFYFLGEKTYVGLTLDLVHQGPLDTARVDVLAGADEQPVLTREFGLTGPSSTTTLRARWETDPEEWVRGMATVNLATLTGRTDALSADDRVYFTIPPVREGRIGLVALSPYLRAALDPDVMRGRWSVEELDPSTVDPEAPLADLADVLLLEARYAQSEKIRRLALRYLNNERGVVLVLNQVTPLAKGFLRELGFEALERRDGPAQTFRYFNVYHPIFQPFAEGELGDLLTVQVRRHVRLRSNLARPLVYGHAGGALMAEGLATKGRLLVFTFGFGLESTDWPIQPSFIPFLDLTLQYARARTPFETSWTPGDLYGVELPEDREVAELAVARETGEGPVEVLRQAVGEGVGQARFRVPDEPGIYRILLDQEEEPYRLLAVNPSPEESRLVFDPEPAALHAWRFASPEETPSEPATESFEVVPRSEILKGRLWWWLALFGFFALFAEASLLGLRKESS